MTFTKEWFKAAGIRAIKTFAQALAAEIGTGAVGIGDVAWAKALSVAAVAALISLLMSMGGLPEAQEK